LTLSRDQRRLRDHGRRWRGDEGAGHRSVREAIPRRRVHRPRPRLSPSRRERWAAAPDRAHQGSARRLAGGHRVRSDAAGSRPGPSRHLGLLPLGRPRSARRGAQPAPGGGDRADAQRRWSGCRAQRGAPPEAACDVAFHRPGRRGHPRRPCRPPTPVGAARRRAGDRRAPHHSGRHRRQQSTQPGQQVPGLAAGGRRPLCARIQLLPARRDASRVGCPLLVLVCDQDQSALAASAVRAARRAPRGELVRMPGGHYEPFLGGHEQAAEAELSFLGRHLLGPVGGASLPSGRHQRGTR
jgi:hypothetical protein